MAAGPPLTTATPLRQTQGYLGRLARGHEAHPDCEMATAFSRQALADFPALLHGPTLPLALRTALVGSTAAAWQPVAHGMAMQALLLDVAFRGDEAACTAWLRATCDRLFGAPMYRALFLVLSPNLLILGAQMRWQMFMRGVDFMALGGTQSSHRVRLRYPPELCDAFVVGRIAVAFVAALAAAGARAASFELEAVAATEAVVAVRWTATR